MANSNPACQPPFSSCEECFGPSHNLPRYLYLSGPPPVDQVLELQNSGIIYEWVTISGEGDPHVFDCQGDCNVLLSDGVVFQIKKCSEGSCSPIQYDFTLSTGSFSVSESSP